MVQNRSHRSRATFATRNQLRSRIRTGAALLAASATLSTPATGASTDAGRHALGPEHTPPRASLALRRCTCMRPWRLFRKRRCRARPYLTHGKVRNGGMQLATRFSEISFSTRTHLRTPLFDLGGRGSKKKKSETAATLCRAGPNGLWRRRHAESKPLRCACGGRGR